VIDTFEDVSVEGMAVVRKRVEQRAIDKAVAAGADPRTTTVVESEAIPIACESSQICRTIHRLTRRHHWPMQILRESSWRLDRIRYPTRPPFCRYHPTHLLHIRHLPHLAPRSHQSNPHPPRKRYRMDSNQHDILQTHSQGRSVAPL
jgi:hypothetical protein